MPRLSWNEIDRAVDRFYQRVLRQRRRPRRLALHTVSGIGGGVTKRNQSGMELMEQYDDRRQSNGRFHRSNPLHS